MRNPAILDRLDHLADGHLAELDLKSSLYCLGKTDANLDKVDFELRNAS